MNFIFFFTFKHIATIITNNIFSRVRDPIGWMALDAIAMDVWHCLTHIAYIVYNIHYIRVFAISLQIVFALELLFISILVLITFKIV